MSAPLRTAVVTGGHSYDVPGFHRLFRALAGVDAYVQHLDDFCSSSPAVREGWDVVLFFTMMREGPVDDGLPWYSGQPRTALARLGETPQGVVVLHHALLSYPQWPHWRRLSGLAPAYQSYHHDQHLRTRVAAPDHPIVAGIAYWDMTDETYVHGDCDPDNRVLLTTDHQPSMRTLAWAREVGPARVFCYQGGHDAKAWDHPTFREVLRRGILWAGRTL